MRSEDTVVGDIVFMAAGAKIAADGRVLVTNKAKTDNSILTGEPDKVSLTVESPKGDAGNIAHAANMVFQGTTLSEGAVAAVVTATGNFTVDGRVREMAYYIDPRDSEVPPGVRARPVAQCSKELLDKGLLATRSLDDLVTLRSTLQNNNDSGSTAVVLVDDALWPEAWMPSDTWCVAQHQLLKLCFRLN